MYLAETWSGSQKFPDTSYTQFHEVREWQGAQGKGLYGCSGSLVGSENNLLFSFSFQGDLCKLSSIELFHVRADDIFCALGAKNMSSRDANARSVGRPTIAGLAKAKCAHGSHVARRLCLLRSCFGILATQSAEVSSVVRIRQRLLTTESGVVTRYTLLSVLINDSMPFYFTHRFALHSPRRRYVTYCLMCLFCRARNSACVCCVSVSVKTCPSVPHSRHRPLFQHRIHSACIPHRNGSV